MPIRIKNSASTDPVVGLGTRIGNKSVTITEVYVENLQVFPDPTTTTTTTTTDQPIPVEMIVVIAASAGLVVIIVVVVFIRKR